MTLTEEPQNLLELRQFYLTQVAQFYQQIQVWGTDKLKFTLPEDRWISGLGVQIFRFGRA